MRVQFFIGPMLMFVVASCGEPSPAPARSPRAGKVAARNKSQKTAKPAGSSSSIDFDDDGFPMTAPSAAVVASAKATPDDFKPATPAPSKKRDVVVLDPSQPRDAAFNEGISKLDKKRILDLAYGKGKYLSEYTQCPDSVGGNLDSRRARGFFKPFVAQLIRGAFTKAGAPEALAYVYNEECNAQGSISNQVVILEGDAVKANVNVPTGGIGLTSTIDAVFDLDGDGRSEFIRTVTNMSPVERATAHVMRLSGGALETIQSFQVLEYGCPGASSIDFSIVHVVQEPGAPPAINLEKKTKPCP